MREERLPFTVLLPDEPGVPIEIYDQSVTLHMAVAEKNSISKLGTAWDAAGVYLLLDVHDADGSYGVYVGKAPGGIRSRLMEHERSRRWSKALLIRRDNHSGLSSAHVGWLEGDLFELFSAAQRARLHNQNRPGDKTVPPYDIRILESFRDPISRVLRLIGYDPSSVEELSTQFPRDNKTRARYDVTLAKIIAAGLLTGAEQLVSVNTVWPATAQLRADGTIEFDGQSFAFPSAAAAAVKGGNANGWDFWAVEKDAGSKRLSAYRQELLNSLAVDDDA
ncbi:hypothetical protein ET475_13580 [Microbacterium protaetiae]|uniref:RAMA domain-containing protein n=1 Tax=Microbacterium protaetiae TaxID=2509458 RepID=A0A4P6EL48_9MICO|nr:hypothetical protein [Microbacterium protaetiae]QAY60917.1 hypothetical protein ET475_13580 [Microbacterium protaetiae]